MVEEDRMEKEEERPTTVSFSFLGFLPQEKGS